MELPHLIVFYLFLEQFHTDYSKYTYMPRRQAASQDKARQAATIAVNDGRPLSFCRKSKWNLTEKKITSCSFQWVDIILFSLGFFFCRQPPWSCVAPTVCVCAISTCTGLLRLCVSACMFVCVCECFIIIFRAARLEAPAFCRFFIYLFYAYAHTRQAVWQVSPTEWLPGWLADCLCPCPCLRLRLLATPCCRRSWWWHCRGCGCSVTRSGVCLARAKEGEDEKCVPIILCIVLCGIYTLIFVVF